MEQTMRWFGPKYGLPLAGFASGFVSSAATIYAMGQKAAGNPAMTGAAVSGAVFSSFSTILQMAIVIAMVQPSLLLAMVVPLTLGGAVAALYALLILVAGARDPQPPAALENGHAFNLRTSAGFAALLSIALLLSAALNVWLGDAGVLLGAAVSGLADAHATAASAASLLSAHKVGVHDAVVAILIGLSTNTATKVFLAFQSGGRDYAIKIVPGLLAMLVATWLGFAISR